MIYTDRSRIVARMECPRMGYLQYAADGKGWSPAGTSLPLATGIAIHEAFCRLLSGELLPAVLASTLATYREELLKGRDPLDPVVTHLLVEQQALLAGIIQTWFHHRLPQILAEFEVALFPGTDEPWLEKEFTAQIAPGISAMLRMDAVLRRRTTGELVIWDFKTLSYPSSDWYEQWAHNAQTYLYVHAVAAFTGEPVEGISYEGLVKGVRRTETGKVPWQGMKVQASPYCYGYNGPEGIQVAYTSKRGYRKVGSWQDHTPYDWFTQVLLPAHEETRLFDELFCIVPPINPARWEIDRWLKQTAWSERLIEQYLKEVREAAQQGDVQEVRELVDTYFPTNEARCFKYGPENKCSFTPLCFAFEPDPVEMGFVPRVPHHDTETT